MAENEQKKVTVHIPAQAIAGFAWDGVDYQPGDEFEFDAKYAEIYEASGRLKIGPKPKGTDNKPAGQQK